MAMRSDADPDDVPTCRNLTAWLARNEPATRPHIAALRAEVMATAAREDRAALLGNPYTLLSEGFFWPVCVPAVESGTKGERAHLADLVERLLNSPDQALAEAVVIRVAHPLTDEPAYWSVLAPHAGPTLRWTAEHH